MSTYEPPYTITAEILNRVGAISFGLGRLTVLTDQAKALRLRRINRVRTIHGSLAIEGNTLSEAQITAILEGKRVIASPREVQEVKNALVAYDLFDTWKPSSENDLLDAHRILMSGLIDEAGLYRHGGVGVMAGSQVMHMAPPADRVPQLMGDLFGWLADTDAHPLIAFMLRMILDTVTRSTPEVAPEVTPEVRVVSVLAGEMTRQQLKEALGLKDDEHLRKAYLRPALEAGLIEMTIPDKPRSSKQKYRLTEKGRQLMVRRRGG